MEVSTIKVVKTKIDGDYTINTYDNGVIEKYLTDFPPHEVQPQILTEDQEIALQTMVNTEMLLVLAELESM